MKGFSNNLLPNLVQTNRTSSVIYTLFLGPIAILAMLLLTAPMLGQSGVNSVATNALYPEVSITFGAILNANKEAKLIAGPQLILQNYSTERDTNAQSTDGVYYTGPSGGTGGVEFKDVNFRRQSRISSITVRHGTYIDGISFTIADWNSGRVIKTVTHGGTGGRSTSFKLERDEYITKIEGRYGRYVDGIRIHTNLRRTPWFGGSGGVPFTYEAPAGYQIVGFCGRGGRFIDSLGVLIRKR